MDLFFYEPNKREACHVDVEDNRILFAASRPAEIQPGEIIKVQTDVFIKPEDGYLFILLPHPAIVEKALDLFPGNFYLADPEGTKPLVIGVRNNGRNAFIVRPGQNIAFGVGIKTETLRLHDFTPTTNKPAMTGENKPQRKNSINFEVK